MKLNYAPQVGLRRRKPQQRRQILAFWAGVAIIVLFELILMAKSWSIDTGLPILGPQAAPDATDPASPSVPAGPG